MPGLTAKQEAFALAVFKGSNASNAYRGAYAPKRMSDKTINEAASRLLKNSKVAARIAELRAPGVEAAQLTDERTLRELASIAYAEAGTVSTSDRLKAIDLAMKHQGLFEKDNSQQRESLILKVTPAQVSR